MSQTVEISKVNRLADRAWAEHAKALYTRQSLGAPVTRFPKLDQAEAEARADLGRSMMREAAAIDLRALPHEDATTLKVVTTLAQRWSRDADWWWLAQDLVGL